MTLVWLECPLGAVTLGGVVAGEGVVYDTELVGHGSAGLRWDNTPCTPVHVVIKFFNSYDINHAVDELLQAAIHLQYTCTCETVWLLSTQT